jgi:hypothetical protein
MGPVACGLHNKGPAHDTNHLMHPTDGVLCHATSLIITLLHSILSLHIKGGGIS